MQSFLESTRLQEEVIDDILCLFALSLKRLDFFTLASVGSIYFKKRCARDL
jgi:hypothetical protein